VRLLDNTHSDKTDTHDARSTAIVAVRNSRLRQVGLDGIHPTTAIDVERKALARDLLTEVRRLDRELHDHRCPHPRSRRGIRQAPPLSGLPEPVAELRQALIWSWPDVERWAKATGRLPRS
jgi:hypothetical protein